MRTNLFEETKTVVIKTNNSCNLKCTYCYDEFNNNKPFNSINATNVHLILKELARYSKSINIDNLNLIWHGGEPLLMGLDFYREVITIQKNFNLSFSNLMQTNAVQINNDWIRFFKENNFKIGVSFDGSISANKIHRQQTEKVVENIKLLNENFIYPSLICVISDLNCSMYQDMFDYLCTIQTEYVDLIPCYENNGRYSLSNSNYIDFMIKIFDLWWKSDRKINFRFFNNIIDKMQGKVASIDYISCNLTGKCGEIISINSDHKIYFCDCLPKEEKFSIGNINQGLKQIIKSKNYQELKYTNDYSSKDCKSCEYLSICGKGCLTRRVNLNHNSDLKDYYCEARKTLFLHIKTKLGLNKITNKIIGIPSFTRGPQPISNN